jgi:phage terminase large subunit
MVADLIGFVREHKIILKSRKLIDECLSFVRNKRGKPEAQQGCHDDRVMAMAIALQVWKANPSLVINLPVIKPEMDWNRKNWEAKMAKKKKNKAKVYAI